MAHQRTGRKIVIPGGSGHLGQLLTAHLVGRGDRVVVLGRSRAPEGHVEGVSHARWNGVDLGAWASEIDGADAVINLAGRTVDCRYNKTNLEQMLSSRTDSTRVIGAAIEAAAAPPPVWLQMSTATIYAHRYDAPNDEETGEIGGRESGVPEYWRTSVHIAEEWERALAEATVPSTRRVALRTAMVMSRTPGGPFAALRRLARLGLGGPVAGGRMYMSWIHELDFVRAVDHLLENDDMGGAVNLAAPTPVPQAEFMAELRSAVGMPLGLPAAKWMVAAGAFVLRTDAELVLKSRRVVPGRLLRAGFGFRYPEWREAAVDLVGS